MRRDRVVIVPRVAHEGGEEDQGLRPGVDRPMRPSSRHVGNGAGTELEDAVMTAASVARSSSPAPDRPGRPRNARVPRGSGPWSCSTHLRPCPLRGRSSTSRSPTRSQARHVVDAIDHGILILDRGSPEDVADIRQAAHIRPAVRFEPTDRVDPRDEWLELTDHAAALLPGSTNVLNACLVSVPSNDATASSRPTTVRGRSARGTDPHGPARRRACSRPSSSRCCRRH